MKGEPWGTQHGNESLLLEYATQMKMEATEGREIQPCWRKRPLTTTVSQELITLEPLNYGITPYTHHTEQTLFPKAVPLARYIFYPSKSTASKQKRKLMF